MYVTEEGLKNLKYYKYGAVDLSPLSKYVLQPYWSYMVQFFPLWMAPNLITLLGLLCVVLNVLLVAIYIPDLETPSHSWIYFSCALGIWVYSTFDNVDGKQARRTNSSSPLGELFDHGCDALNCCFGAIIQAAGMGLGNSWYAAYVAYLAICAFFFSTWEEYHTGILYLGYINGPTEGLVIACTVLIVSGLYGPAVWKLPLSSILPASFSTALPSNWKIVDALALQMGVLLILMHVPLSLRAVYKACKKNNTSFAVALLQLVPFAVWSLASFFWLASPTSVILRKHMLLFIGATGIVFGRMASQIIQAYVTKWTFPYFTILQIPLIFGAILANSEVLFGKRVFTAETEYGYLVGFFLFSLFGYIHWAFVIIDKFCKHLGIKCLSIPYPQSEDRSKKSK
ncbi:hypothetical protein MP638_004533 [Amoeboaphelidium occidentale]|nr:hypothetical protein MP638_004533 [Amoeboaphelidium occidentale]